MDVRIENCFYSAEEVSQITAKAVQQMAKMAKIARIVNDEKKTFSSGQIFHISHSGQIRSTFALSRYGDHFGPFWCTTWVTPPPLYDWF